MGACALNHFRAVRPRPGPAAPLPGNAFPSHLKQWSVKPPAVSPPNTDMADEPGAKAEPYSFWSLGAPPTAAPAPEPDAAEARVEDEARALRESVAAVRAQIKNRGKATEATTEQETPAAKPQHTPAVPTPRRDTSKVALEAKPASRGHEALVKPAWRKIPRTPHRKNQQSDAEGIVLLGSHFTGPAIAAHLEGTGTLATNYPRPRRSVPGSTAYNPILHSGDTNCEQPQSRRRSAAACRAFAEM